MDLRVAVVTGASRGIGREIARQLLERGFEVIAASRDVSDPPKGAQPFGLDVAREDQIDALARHLRSGVDVLVNNSGISMRGFDERVARKTLDVNFFGALRTTDALLPRMRPGGRVVMVSSGLGRLSGLPSDGLRAELLAPALTKDGLVRLMNEFVEGVAEGTHAQRGWPSSAYSVSKMGMNMLARILARDLAADPRGIGVTSADPGWVRTAMGGSGAPRSVEEGARTPVWLALSPDAPKSGFFRDEKPTPW
jgi:carbonyl reductase 1